MRARNPRKGSIICRKQIDKTLVCRPARCYFLKMHWAFVHRALVILLSVAIVAGLTTRVVQAKPMDTMMMSAMAADMPMHGKCDDCAGGEKAATPIACALYCNGVVALGTPSVALDLVFAGFVTATVEANATDYRSPPDPYPPRSTHMS